MSKEGVLKTIGRMISDEAFRKGVLADPSKAIAKSGYELTDVELAGIKKLTPRDLQVIVKKRLGPDTVAGYDIDVRTARV